MANTHTTLTSLFKDIADTIRAKSGFSDQDLIVADDFPDAISLISGIDTSGATATADDIAKGKTAYVNGGKVTGTVDEITRVLSTTRGSLSTTIGNSRIVAKSPEQSSNTLFRKGSQWAVEFAPSEFGDATEADVAAGKTFTSAAGLKVTGTHIENTSLDTSDATATAADIAKNKTAYVNGEKVTGTIRTKSSGENYLPTSTTNAGTTQIKFTAEIGTDILLRSGSTITLTEQLSNLGDAEAADVAAGKTFTSTAGLKMTGTYEGGGIQAQRITSASEAIAISGSGTVKVWGYGFKSSQVGGTTYAFVGDGYYFGSYGTPSKTSLTFSISNGKLSGLPAGLTALDVLVTIGVS